ncbi:MAG: hypothetical protein AB7S65_03640, partial [Sulfuricurvum sp.]
MRSWTSSLSILRYTFISIALSATLIAGSFEDGIKAFDKKDYATAVKLWQPMAENGNMAAQYNLGILYENGYGVPRNDSEAFKWYLKAAEQGHIDAQYNVGVMYGAGVGIEKNDRQAQQWLSKAASQGDKEAKKILETRYGGSAAMNVAAVKTEEKAQTPAITSKKSKSKKKRSKTSVPAPQESIAVAPVVPVAVQKPKAPEAATVVDPMPIVAAAPVQAEPVSVPAVSSPVLPAATEGNGMSEAAKWMMKSAKQGDPRAQYNLGLLYAEGNGVEK